MESHSAVPTEALRVRRPRGTRLRGVGVMIGLIASAVLVWQSTQAAFTAETRNNDNVWQAGTVVLSDNVPGAAWFNATGLKPGSTGTQCVLVEYDGTTQADVRLYGANHAIVDANTDGDLETYLTLRVQIGDEGASCASPGTQVDLFATAAIGTFRTGSTNWTTGLSNDTWQPSAINTVRPYTFTYTLLDNNAAQGDRYEIDFVWEARTE